MRHILPLRSRCLLAILGMALLTMGGCKNRDQSNEKKGKNEVESSVLNPQLKQSYMEDAARLTARELNSLTQRGGGDPPVELPAARIQFYMDVLTRSYQLMQSDPAVPDVSHIHTFARPNLHEVMVVLRPDASFKDEWKAGRATTSDLYVNQIMGKYRLQVKNFRESPTGARAMVYAPQPVNTPALAFVLGNVEGIKLAEPNSMVGDGNDIRWVSGGKQGMALEYSVGAGDCPSGCIHRKYWTFHVDGEGKITYQGTRGEIPDELDGE